MPSERRPKPPRDGAEDAIRDALERTVASVLPAPPGSVLVMTFPEDVDWSDAGFVERISALLRDMKARHGFENIIAIKHGFKLESLDDSALANVGLYRALPPEGGFVPDMGDAT